MCDRTSRYNLSLVQRSDHDYSCADNENNNANMMRNANSDLELMSGPLLVFVLGPPCAGKSTLCTALAQRYNLDHFSVGDEMRSLLSSHPTGPAARIKTLFTTSELEVFATNVRAGTLGPVNQTPKYVIERIFPGDVDSEKVRVLVDGFPRNFDRWETFKKAVEDVWQPSEGTIAIILDVNRTIALERFVSRGRAGDVFERRFDEHVATIGDIEETMRHDGVTVQNVLCEGGMDAVTIVEQLASDEAWVRAVRQICTDSPINR